MPKFDITPEYLSARRDAQQLIEMCDRLRDALDDHKRQTEKAVSKLECRIHELEDSIAGLAANQTARAGDDFAQFADNNPQPSRQSAMQPAAADGDFAQFVADGGGDSRLNVDELRSLRQKLAAKLAEQQAISWWEQ